MPTIRPFFGSMVFHQIDETSDGTSQKSWSSSNYISGRYSDHGFFPRAHPPTLTLDNYTTYGFRFPHKLQEISSESLLRTGIFRLPDKYTIRPIEPSHSKITSNPQRNEGHSEQKGGILKETSLIRRATFRLNSSGFFQPPFITELSRD